jgi:hypothetical protein
MYKQIVISLLPALLIFCPALAGEPVDPEEQQCVITHIVHPGYRIDSIRPEGFEPQVTGMDFMSDGSLIVGTAVPVGNPGIPLDFPAGPRSRVYRLSNVIGNDASQITYNEIAGGLYEIMGLKVVDDEIYVSDKFNLYRLTGKDANGVYQTKDTITAWPSSGIDNPILSFHEYPFGLLYKDGYFYAALSSPIKAGGLPLETQPTLGRGCLLRIDRNRGDWEIIAAGLATPAGMAWGPYGSIWITDNEEGWKPANNIYHIQKGRTYGYPNHSDTRINLNGQTVDVTRTAPTPAAVLAEKRVISESLGQPVLVDRGIFKGQFLVGDMSQGGIRRIFVERINGEYQGAIFSFCGGFEIGPWRIAKGPNGEFYIGGIGDGSIWSWGWEFSRFGLQRLAPKPGADTTFEILAVRSRKTGMELEFTKAVNPTANDPALYRVRQWWYHPTPHYGGPERHPDSTYDSSWYDVDYIGTGCEGEGNASQRLNIPVQSVTISSEGKGVFLELPGLRGPKEYTDLVTEQPAIAGMVTHIQLSHEFKSAAGDDPWFYNTWYTLNSISQSDPFTEVSIIDGCADPDYLEYNPNVTVHVQDSCKTLGVRTEFTKGPVFSLSPSEISIDGEHTLKVLNVNGEVVFSGSGTGPGDYSLSGYEPGIYFVNVTAGKRKVLRRVVVF